MVQGQLWVIDIGATLLNPHPLLRCYKYDPEVPGSFVREGRFKNPVRDIIGSQQVTFQCNAITY